MKNSLLARFAENVFWLARYMERAENMARVLDITSTHARNQQGLHDWTTILDLNGDMERFREKHGRPTTRGIVRFYSIDAANSTSILSSIAQARENARSLRHLISTEMWTQINMLHVQLRGLDDRDIVPRRLSGVCATVKLGCQAHTGITEGTLYRDQASDFYWMGKAIERADQISRLIDIGARRAQQAEQQWGTAPLDSHWNAMLRTAAGYQAFRRTHRVRLIGHEVIGFLLLDPEFPRSLSACLADALYYLDLLRDQEGIPTVQSAIDLIRKLQRMVRGIDFAGLTAEELHVFIDRIQRDLIGITAELSRSCFGGADKPR